MNRKVSYGKKKEGLVLLTEAMQQKISTRWEDLAPEILARKEEDYHGIDIVNDEGLQQLIIKINENLIPHFAQRAWAEKNFIMRPRYTPEAARQEITLKKEKDQAIESVGRYARLAYRKLDDYLDKKGVEDPEKNGWKLLGSIIKRSADAFNKALETYEDRTYADLDFRHLVDFDAVPIRYEKAIQKDRQNKFRDL